MTRTCGLTVEKENILGSKGRFRVFFFFLPTMGGDRGRISFTNEIHGKSKEMKEFMKFVVG